MADTNSTTSVLFVCLGNICRSPAAEGLARSLAEDEGWVSSILIDSAGTAGFQVGAPADSRMRAAAEERGIFLASRARKLVVKDLERFDLVIAMDRENLADIRRLSDSPRAIIKLLSEYLDGDWPLDVPDPYYGGDTGFELVLNMLDAACPKILEELMQSRSAGE